MEINISKHSLKKMQLFLRKKKISLVMISKEINYSEVYIRQVFSGGVPISKNLLDAFLRGVINLLNRNVLEFYDLLQQDSELFRHYQFIFDEKDGEKREKR